MNGRMQGAKTSWRRIAVAVESHYIKIRNNFRKTNKGPELPDYHDLEEMLRPYVEREVLLARIEEARLVAGTSLTARIKELGKQLYEVEAAMSEEDRL
jgi:hypothetical protein